MFSFPNPDSLRDKKIIVICQGWRGFGVRGPLKAENSPIYGFEHDL